MKWQWALAHRSVRSNGSESYERDERYDEKTQIMAGYKGE